jgi:DNA (cytosine-5)-methyltransferase 1
MRHGSLFSGIGGFDLAAEWCGWENVFHCEWNTFGQKVLKHHFPNSISYNDITKTDFTIHRGSIDIISGGFPCQPYSSAGKRLGKEDERHLWPEMLRAIREIQPSWVVGENVRGLTNWNGGLVFDEVQTELEAEGYEVLPFLLPACAVNAPHRRDRIWFVAFKDTNKNGRGSEQWQKETDKWQFRNSCSGNNELVRTNNEKVRTTTDTRKLRLEQCENSRKMEGGQGEISKKGNKFTLQPKADGNTSNATDTDCNGLDQCNSAYEISATDGRINALSNINESNGNGNITDTKNERLERLRGEKGGYSKFYRGQNGLQKWENFPTQSPICGGDDGLPRELDNITFSKWRNESIKAYGNAIVPQVAYQIFKSICQYQEL